LEIEPASAEVRKNLDAALAKRQRIQDAADPRETAAK
jgi:hypothetical protein